MSQYVALDLDVGSDDFRQWRRLYPPNGNGIPMIFIVSPGGVEYINQSGAPQGEGLARMLQDGLRRAGEEFRLAQAEQREREDPPEEVVTEEETPDSEDSGPPVEEYETIVDKLRRADSYLRMAETFMDSRPSKAREYAQNIIDLVPDSSQAREARRILEDLE